MWPDPIVVCDPLLEKAPQVPLVAKLLQCPGCCGVGGDVEVSDPAGSDFQKNEYIENSKGSAHKLPKSLSKGS
jgi:hypothetical protein